MGQYDVVGVGTQESTRVGLAILDRAGARGKDECEKWQATQDQH